MVDVRSQPHSRFSPQFSKGALAPAIEGADIGYAHLPDLGGRPDGSTYYDQLGHVLYGLVAESDRFKRAIETLEDLLDLQVVAIMCSEESPTECHRRLLVGRVLATRGWEILHLRGDGRIQPESELADLTGPAVEDGLFEGGELSTWRSIRSVSPSGRPPTSSPR